MLYNNASYCKLFFISFYNHLIFFFTSLISDIDQHKGDNYKNSTNSTTFIKELTFGTNTKPLNDVKRTLGANIDKLFQIYKDKKIDYFNTMISG